MIKRIRLRLFNFNTEIGQHRTCGEAQFNGIVTLQTGL
jgi:hypothetical protein